MNKIDGVRLPSLPISGLRHVRDLIYYDGPFLSQYAHPNGDDYLYYWCDCDKVANRWMILRVSEASILRLVNRFVPLDYIIPKNCRDSFVYICDIASDGTIKNVQLVTLALIPEDYKPEAGAYLDFSDKPASEKSYSVLVEGGWSVRALGDFPSVFSKVYSVLYGLNVLHLPKFGDYPWRGGFSSMHFFKWAALRIPSEDRPSVSAMQYASPGFMRFSLHGPTADQVTQCILDCGTDNENMHDHYHELASYIRKHKLNEIHSPLDLTWSAHNDELRRLALNMLRGFTSVNPEAFTETSARPFETAKIAMAFYRYVADLVSFESNGMVRFPQNSSVENLKL